MKKYYYIIYKVTNKINGKFYIGSHKTVNLDDGYMGSGKYLKYAQEKYGLENFEKEILYIFNNPEEMYNKEAEIVDEDFVSENNTYNIKVGGFGGFDYINQNGLAFGGDPVNAYKKSRSNLDITSHSRKAREKGRERLRKILSENPDYLKGRYCQKGEKNHMYGKAHSVETRNKMSESQLGKKNSQYGKMWIYSLEEKRSIKIDKNDPIPEGWFKGRKIKFSVI